MAYQPPASHPVFFDGTQVNTSSWVDDGLGVHLSAIEGWEGGVEFEDNREPRPGGDGERVNTGRMRGRELIVSGRVCGSSWADVQTRKRALAGVFVPSSLEKLFKVPLPGAAWTGADADGVPGDYAAVLDGSSQYGSVPYAAALNPAAFTVEAWVKPDAIGTLQTIYHSANATTNGFRIQLLATGVVRFNPMSSGATNVDGSVLTAGVWNHVAVTHNGTAARVYVDGDLTGGPTSAAYAPNTSANTGVGAIAAGGQPFDGEIDEVAVYSSALSATRIQAHHVAGRSEAGNFVEEIQQDSPVAWYRMHDGDAPSIMADSSGNARHGTWTGTPGLDAPTTGAPAYTDSGMVDFERVTARVVEPIRFDEREGPLVQSFAVALRASDPLIYSDVVTTTTDAVVGDDQWSASVSNTGTAPTPATIKIASADASELSWNVVSGGATISSGTLDSGVDLVSPGSATIDGPARDVRITLPSVADIVSESSEPVHAYYRFSDASGNPQDSSGNGYHLTASGTFVDDYEVPSLFDADANTALRLKRNATGAVTVTGGGLGTALTAANTPWAAYMAFQRNSPFSNATLLRFDDGTDGFRIIFDGSGRLRIFNVTTGASDPTSISIAAGRRYLLYMFVEATAGGNHRQYLGVYDTATGDAAGSITATVVSGVPVAANTVLGPAIMSGTSDGTLVIDELVIADASGANPLPLRDQLRSAMFSGEGASSFGNLSNLTGWPTLNPGTNTVTINAGDTATTGTMTVTHRNARV